ncbi:MAG: helix-turn-helix domain-containing protein [Moorea sp. SIO2I5]|nr:helix-turn-helix domain-containing protein [Moorena sp. SIO2I5]
MPAALRITLTTQEHQTLKELEVAECVPRRTKQRATALRINAKGWKVKAIAFGAASPIADYLGWAQSTVRQTIHRWNHHGLAGLWEAKGRGIKPSWTSQDWEALEQWLQEPRSISSRQLSQRWAKQRQVFVGAEQVRRILKKKWRWKRFRKKPPVPKNPELKAAKKRDLQTLKLWAQEDLIT